MSRPTRRGAGRDVGLVAAARLRGARPSRLAPWLAAGTSLRIVAAPVVMALILADNRSASRAGAAIFAAAATTDLLDGWVARRWGATTTLGSFLDTTADKLLVAAGLLALVSVDRVSPWLAMLIVGREVAILGLRGTVAAEGTVFAPSPGGKAKAVMQFLAVFLAILRPGGQVAGAYVDEWAMIAAAAITLVTGLDYLVRYGAALRRSP
jgi:CDP-diacylglycerol--glycerol-3-phosphate 3-phosphatidyltransferase